MSCSDPTLADKCVNNHQACKICTNREGYTESHNWFYDKADYEKMYPKTNANHGTKKGIE